MKTTAWRLYAHVHYIYTTSYSQENNPRKTPLPETTKWDCLYIYANNKKESWEGGFCLKEVIRWTRLHRFKSTPYHPIPSTPPWTHPPTHPPTHTRFPTPSYPLPLLASPEAYVRDPSVPAIYLSSGEAQFSLTMIRHSIINHVTLPQQQTHSKQLLELVEKYCGIHHLHTLTLLLGPSINSSQLSWKSPP